MASNPVTIDPGKILNRSNLLKVIALALAAVACFKGFGTVPKMASSAGAPVNDVINTALPAIGGILAWLWARRSQAASLLADSLSPDVVQAAISFVSNPTDPVNDVRVGMLLLSHYQAKYPGNPMLADLESFCAKLQTAAIAKLPSVP
jgi:hypothetical protein